MFGDNQIRKQDLTTPFQLHVQEVFDTIQGEGPFAGWPATFIRLAGCNLACTFCDTEFESGMLNPKDTTTEILEMVQAKGKTPSLVVITGGEPFRQEIGPLIELLLSAGVMHVQIETAGTLWLESMEQYFEDSLEDSNVSIVCSPKTGKINPNIEKHCMDWKYIIQAGQVSQIDGLPIGSTQNKELTDVVLYRPRWDQDQHTIWLQPCDECDPIKNKANTDEAVAQCLLHGYRLCLQVHKIINMP